MTLVLPSDTWRLPYPSYQQSEVLIMCVSGGSGGWTCVIEHPHPCYSGDNGNLGVLLMGM